MEHLCWCRDGSEGKIGSGYSIAQFEASQPGGVRVPVLYHLFSPKEPGHMSEPQVFMDCMTRVAPHVGKLEWWVLDRGFQSARYHEHMDGLGARWAVRVKVGAKLQAPETVFLEDGTKTDVRAVMRDATKKGSEPLLKISRKVKRRKRAFQIWAAKVWRSNGKNKKAPRGPARTLLIVKARALEPWVILASEWKGTDAHALQIFDAYARRWDAEEANRAMKDRRGWGLNLEDLRALKFFGIRRLVMLAATVYLFLAELRLAGERVIGAVVVAVRSFGEARDETYRLLRGVGELLNRMPRWRLREWTRGP